MDQDRNAVSSDVAGETETLVGVLGTAAAEGFDNQFVARADGDIDCGGCKRAVNAASMRIERVRRLEGASDPADMMIVAWCICPVCESRGTLTLGFGPNASAPDEAVLAHLDLRDAEAAPSGKEVREQRSQD